jgi:peptide deformylase
MAVLEIKTYPEDVLKGKAHAIKDIDADLQRLIDDMIETMYAAPGIGLAAPQVGVPKRLIVIDVSTKEEKHPVIVLINPEIVEAEGSVDSEEGCLSLPGHTVSIKRAGHVRVKGLDREGNTVELETDGLLARALQHEIDHLDGVLIIDRLSTIKREFFKKRYFKALKEAQLRA